MYNNPVPEGTAVYFTTTGGSISTNSGFTDEKGMATVTLYAANPYPTRQNSNRIENPNTEGPEYFDMPVSALLRPWFDLDGDGTLNNGIAIVTAYTEGVDDEDNDVTVWNYTPIIFSFAPTTFTVESAAPTVYRGETATITITLRDANGNPVMGGSELKLSSKIGSLSTATITTASPGSTVYTVALTNDLDPLSDLPGNTVINVALTSPNGDVTVTSAPIYMDTNTRP